MSELEQFCEIDGHQWDIYHYSYGLVLGPKSTHDIKICSFCKHKEETIFVPKDNDYQRVISYDTILF